MSPVLGSGILPSGGVDVWAEWRRGARSEIDEMMARAGLAGTAVHQKFLAWVDTAQASGPHRHTDKRARYYDEPRHGDDSGAGSFGPPGFAGDPIVADTGPSFSGDGGESGGGGASGSWDVSS